MRGRRGDAPVVDDCESPPDPHPHPLPAGEGKQAELTLTAVIETLSTLGKAQLPQQLARWLDALDETGRWALIKLVTGGLRIGVSARLAKTAVAALWRHRRAGHRAALAGAHAALSRSIRLARRPRGKTGEQRSGAVPAADAGACARRRRSRRARRRAISWRNGNGTASGSRRWPRGGMAQTIARLYSRTGEDISKSFPDLLDALHLPGAIDGELLIMRDAACSRSTCCSSGSTAKPSRQS